MPERHSVQAIVLTGGRSSRMGGRHKPGIVIGGQSVIDRTLTALYEALPQARVIIAGTDEGMSAQYRRHCTVVREDPPFSGPLAGVAAAADALGTSDGPVLLLGGDLPFISAQTLRRLTRAVADGAAVASCQDATGHLQYLVSGWRACVLRDQLREIADPDGVPLRALYAGLTPELIECDPDELRDIDTPEDVAWAVTTSDGRPVPAELLRAVAGCQQGGGLSPQQTVDILDFARTVKYAPSVANPAVAAFLAGQLAGQDHSVQAALQAVLALADERIGDGHEVTGHAAGTGDIGGLPGGQ